MAVQRIEYYTQQDGRKILKVILKPTKKHSNGSWFYIDACYEDLVKSYCWFISNDYVVAHVGSRSLGNMTTISLHQEISFKCLGRYPKYIDHENGLEFDNIGSNLTEVAQQQNIRNKQSRGYSVGRPWKLGGSCFEPAITLDGRFIRDTSVRYEDEACIKQFQFESANYTDYNYNFFKDRRGDLDIVDLERKGLISAEEATFRHVMRYAKDNAWYVLRYGLEDYFKAHNIPLPSYKLNSEGRMIDEYGRLLCPFG